MKKRNLLILLFILGLLLMMGGAALSAPPGPRGIKQLKRDAVGEFEWTQDPRSHYPSFVRGEAPLATTAQKEADAGKKALAFVQHYADAFGVRNPQSELMVAHTERDSLGMTHVTLQQIYEGVPVYNALMKVHLSADGRSALAVSNGFVPGIELAGTQPRVSAVEAVDIAQKFLPNGTLIASPKLVVYPGIGSKRSGSSARLSWLVELADDSEPARNVYVVDARDGGLSDVIPEIYDARDRKIYDAEHRDNLPGKLVRSEGEGPTGDKDADQCYDYSGETYDYYANTHGRDSYDDQGATMVCTVNYGVNYYNAFWNEQQTVFGDDMVAEDVVAHEWTHAVTQHTANLEYRWQSGALNESFSDIFGAMVDREDWLMGEDLPEELLQGRDALRDLSDPARLGQPAHTDDWVATCTDNEGVHSNSGITNKAYFNIATSIGKNKAERIFYRALTVYLQPTSSLEDARAAAIQAALDLYRDDREVYTAVQDGFNAVGLDGNWNPPPNDCEPCAAVNTLSPEPDGDTLLSDLRAVRDQVFTEDPGRRWSQIYYEHQLEVAWVLLRNSQVRADALAGFRAFDPVFRALLEGDQAAEPVILTPELIAAAERALMGVAENSSPAVREDIIREWERVDPYRFVGWDVRDVWAQLRIEESKSRIYLPLVAPTQ